MRLDRVFKASNTHHQRGHHTGLVELLDVTEKRLALMRMIIYGHS
jgi:hypothetical protein